LCDLEISENFFKSCSKWNNPKTGLVDKRTSGPANTGPVPIPVRLVAGFVAGLKNHQTKKNWDLHQQQIEKNTLHHTSASYIWILNPSPRNRIWNKKLGPWSMSILTVKKNHEYHEIMIFFKLTGRKKTIRKKSWKPCSQKVIRYVWAESVWSDKK